MSDVSLDGRFRAILAIFNDAKTMAAKARDMCKTISSFVPESSITTLLVGLAVLPVWQMLMRWIPLYAMLMVVGTLLVLETVEVYRVVRSRIVALHLRPFVQDMRDRVSKEVVPAAAGCPDSGLRISKPRKVYSTAIFLTENQRHFGGYGWKPPTEPRDPAAW